jgi:hypothetical protein
MLRLFQHPAVLVLLCFSLVGTPVTYRGGASHPHPHTFIEFLMEAESGHFDHHHQGDAEEPEAHDHPEHHHDETAARTPAHAADASASQSAGAAEQFHASVSVFVVGDVGQLALILPDSALPQSSQFQTAFAQGDRVLRGIAHSPIAPPPR